jgi:hypothetical protein
MSYIWHTNNGLFEIFELVCNTQNDISFADESSKIISKLIKGNTASHS